MAGDAADVVVSAGGEGDGGRSGLDGVGGVAGGAAVVSALVHHHNVVGTGREVEHCMHIYVVHYSFIYNNKRKLT